MAPHNNRGKKKRKPQPKRNGPRCPVCSVATIPTSDDTHNWCDRCQIQFDDDPDEGGDYSDHNPTARLERAERRR